MRYPRVSSHIGIIVSDLEKAAGFYKEVMEWYIIMNPTEIFKESDTAIGKMCIDVFGTEWDSFRIPHMTTVGEIGIELFKSLNNTKPKAEFRPFKTGVLHFAVKDPDIKVFTRKLHLKSSALFIII